MSCNYAQNHDLDLALAGAVQLEYRLLHAVAGYVAQRHRTKSRGLVEGVVDSVAGNSVSYAHKIPRVTRRRGVNRESHNHVLGGLIADIDYRHHHVEVLAGCEGVPGQHRAAVALQERDQPRYQVCFVLLSDEYVIALVVERLRRRARHGLLHGDVVLDILLLEALEAPPDQRIAALADGNHLGVGQPAAAPVYYRGIKDAGAAKPVECFPFPGHAAVVHGLICIAR